MQHGEQGRAWHTARCMPVAHTPAQDPALLIPTLSTHGAPPEVLRWIVDRIGGDGAVARKALVRPETLQHR